MYYQHVLREILDPQLTPISAHPDGLPPDFENIGMKIILRSTGYPCLLLSLSFLIMRLCANPELKNRTRRPLDDYLCILAWIFTAGNTVTILAQVGSYKHAYDMRITDLKPSYFRRMAASCVLYGPSMFFAKASIFAMYIRVFGTVTWVRWTSWAAIALFGIGYWSVVPTCGVAFFPYFKDSFDQGWNVNLEKLTRESMVVPGLVVGTCNLATDLVALAIPIPVILGLRMNWRRKLGYCAIFFTAVMGIVVSVLGLVYRINLIEPKRNDGTWWQAAVNLTTIIELSITIIISCAPFAVGFWRRIIQNSTFISSIRSPQHHRKSIHPRSPTPVTFPTIRTSQISSTRSDINLEALRPRCRESISREEDAGSIGPSEHTSTFTQGDFHDQLPYHAV